jgi:hypothetical protein
VRLESYRLPNQDTSRYVLEISGGDYARMKPLDGFDIRLLRECEDSESIADRLLGLEVIARRIEQGTSASE